MEWENTNKLLLKKEWYGIKTGITDSAGPCLATCVMYFDKFSNKCRRYVIVTLSCKSMEARWDESELIA